MGRSGCAPSEVSAEVCAHGWADESRAFRCFIVVVLQQN